MQALYQVVHEMKSELRLLSAITTNNLKYYKYPQ